jgi:diguanylate cyclase (GGDEF)-like protein
VAVARRLEVHHRDGRKFRIQLNVMPVINNQKLLCGAILLVRDASAQASLEERVQSLHERATRDPLTGVGNRAEFDTRLASFVTEHLTAGKAGSMIICDIDHFKSINDTYGHQAGDQALIVFAGVLREVSRQRDLVARYGGEEFVVLCEDCDNATATARAEELRRAVERRGVPSLRGAGMTASFGVTEVQAGDTEETFLARADRALMLAKETGRNRVIQLGSGKKAAPEVPTPSGWMNWFKRNQTKEALSIRECLTPMPIDVTAEKLNGFIADHRASIVQTGADNVTLRVDFRQGFKARRETDRPAELLLHIRWSVVELVGRNGISQNKTKLDMSVSVCKLRDRRRDALLQQALRLLSSLQAYLGAEEIDARARKAMEAATQAAAARGE